MSKAAVIKGNKLVATADTVAEAKAYAKKVGGLALVPVESGARKNGALSDADKKVIVAFTEQRGANGKTLYTDGVSLNGNYIGGSRLAYWGDGKIHLPDRGSKFAEQVQRAVSKEAPKNWLAGSGARKNGAETVQDVIRSAGAQINKRPLPADIARRLLKADGYKRIPSDLAKLRMEAYHVLGRA